MILRRKMMLSFAVIIILNAILGGMIYSDVNNTSSSVNNMTESAMPALDILSNLGDNFDAMSESQNVIISMADGMMAQLESGESLFEETDGLAEVTQVFTPIQVELSDHVSQIEKAQETLQGVVEMAGGFQELSDETQSSTDNSLQMIIIFNMIGVIVAVILAVVLSHIIVSPIQKLTAAANSIGEGNVDATIPEVKGKDEVRDMAESIETLRGAIKFLKK